MSANLNDEIRSLNQLLGALEAGSTFIRWRNRDVTKSEIGILKAEIAYLEASVVLQNASAR
jgi:hypothetical protein